MTTSVSLIVRMPFCDRLKTDCVVIIIFIGANQLLLYVSGLRQEEMLKSGCFAGLGAFI